MKKQAIPSVRELEQLTTHQLSDLLANMVLVLRRLPDVPLVSLQPNLDDHQPLKGDGPARVIRKASRAAGTEDEGVPDWVSK